MKAAVLFASIAALAILAGAYSSARYQAEREAWYAENNHLKTENADLKRRVENETARDGHQPPDHPSKKGLVGATERLSAIEAEILENRAELVQLKSDRLVADEYAKSSTEKLRQQVKRTTEIEHDLAQLQSRRFQMRSHIAKAEDQVSALKGIIDDRQDHATSLDRKIAELVIREEAARSRLITAESANVAIALSDNPNNASAAATAPTMTVDIGAAKLEPAEITEREAQQSRGSIEQAARLDQDRSKGLYRFKTLNVDQGLGGPVALAKNENEPVENDAADEKATSDAWASRQYELGRTLVVRGEQNSGTRELNEAVLAFKAVLGEWPKDQDPLRWAATQNDLGYALALLGQRQASIGTLENAAAACRRALAEIKQDRTPLLWATAQYNLGLTLSGIAEIKNEERLWKNAIKAFQQSVEVFDEEGARAEGIKAKDRLRNAHEELASLKE